MSVPKLRGIEAKKKFVATHTVRCVWHSRLAPGERLRCCCGNPLEGEYFEFLYVGESGEGTLCTGPSCGGELTYESNRIGRPIADPGYFDPYGLGAQVRQPRPGEGGEQGVIRAAPGNREMITAISLLLFFWKKKDGPLLDVRSALRQNPQREPQEWEIRMLNKAVGTTCSYRPGVETLRQLLAAECRRKGVPGRNFRFPFLEQRLRELGAQSHL